MSGNQYVLRDCPQCARNGWNGADKGGSHGVEAAVKRKREPREGAEKLRPRMKRSRMFVKLKEAGLFEPHLWLS